MPFVGHRRVTGWPYACYPGVAGTLRVRAAREICCIEYAGLDWCNVAGVVELPLYIAERRRVVV